MKRGANEGTIYKDSCRDRWVACLHVGYDDQTGKRIRKYRYGKTRAEAKEKLKLLTEQFANTIYHDIDKITVGSWVNKWYDVYAKGRIKPNTCTSYKQMIKKISSYLGKIRLAKLQSIEIQSMVNSLHNKEKLSRRTCQYALAILKMALTRAVNDGLLVKSPALNITLPTQKAKEHYFLTSNDWERLINAYSTTFGGRELMLLIMSKFHSIKIQRKK